MANSVGAFGPSSAGSEVVQRGSPAYSTAGLWTLEGSRQATSTCNFPLQAGRGKDKSRSMGPGAGLGRKKHRSAIADAQLCPLRFLSVEAPVIMALREAH